MIVVSDSTPLITLMKAMQLDVLHKLFGDILIPDAVFHEVTTNDNFPEEAEIIRNSNFIRRVSVKDDRAVLLLQRVTGLDRGESEAIVYADDNRADILLIDENAGRKVAQRVGLAIMGSVGVLVNACREGYLTPSDVEEAFRRMRAANRHISERLMRDALDIVRGIT